MPQLGTIKGITQIANGSSSHSVFRVETTTGMYIVKSVKLAIEKNSEREIKRRTSEETDRNGKNLEKNINHIRLITTTPEEELQHLSQLTTNKIVTTWNNNPKHKLIISIPVALYKVQDTETKTVFYIEIFPEAPGGSLQTIIKTEQNSELLEPLFETLGQRIAQLHVEAKLSHGDPNPANIFYDKESGIFTMIDPHSIMLQLGAAFDIDKFVGYVMDLTDNRGGHVATLAVQGARQLITAFFKGYLRYWDDSTTNTSDDIMFSALKKYRAFLSDRGPSRA